MPTHTSTASARSAAYRLGFAALAAWPVVVLASPPPHPQTDAERAELRGSVKDVATSSRGDATDPDQRPLGVAHYDRQGGLIEDEDVTPDFIRKRTPKRIDRNTVLFQSTMGASTERYVFDANGNATQTTIWYGDKTTGPPDQIARATYDAQNRQMEVRFVGPDGKVGGASTYKRDDAGNVVQEDEWLNDPAPPHAVSTYTYTFDAHGNWVERHQKRTGVSDDSYDYGPVRTLIRTITYYGP